MRAQNYFSVAENNPNGALQAPCRWRLNLNKCLVQPRLVGTCARKSSQDTAPTAGCAGFTLRKKTKKSALRESLSLDKKRPHKCSAPTEPLPTPLWRNGS